jgi:hypothetical protein
MDELIKQSRYHAEQADYYAELGDFKASRRHSIKWQELWYQISLLDKTAPYAIR